VSYRVLFHSPFIHSFSFTGTHPTHSISYAYISSLTGLYPLCDRIICKISHPSTKESTNQKRSREKGVGAMRTSIKLSKPTSDLSRLLLASTRRLSSLARSFVFVVAARRSPRSTLALSLSHTRARLLSPSAGTMVRTPRCTACLIGRVALFSSPQRTHPPTNTHAHAGGARSRTAVHPRRPCRQGLVR